MSRPGRLAVYVTSHGFGHLNRTVAALNLVPEDVAITIRCHFSLFGHWGERLRRPAELQPHVSDVGALNPPGDSSATDGPGTLALAMRVHAEAVARLDEEIAWMKSAGVAAVLCDAPPLPLVAARKAGIPGFLLANFTWADIYAPYAKAAGGDARKFVLDLARCYRHATALFRAEPALAMKDVAPTIPVGLVATAGRDRRAELRRNLGLSRDDKLVYIYVGRYGQANLGWERLGAMPGIHFVGFHAAPTGPLPNLHVVDPAGWTGADLAASADAIVAKAGYGTVCEAMVARTPLIYPPRTGFSEHRALDRALREWGGGVPTPARAFARLRIAPQLEQALSLRPGPPPYPVDGAARVAGHLTGICRGEPVPDVLALGG